MEMTIEHETEEEEEEEPQQQQQQQQLLADAAAVEEPFNKPCSAENCTAGATAADGGSWPCLLTLATLAAAVLSLAVVLRRAVGGFALPGDTCMHFDCSSAARNGSDGPIVLGTLCYSAAAKGGFHMGGAAGGDEEAGDAGDLVKPLLSHQH